MISLAADNKWEAAEEGKEGRKGKEEKIVERGGSTAGEKDWDPTVESIILLDIYKRV